MHVVLAWPRRACTVVPHSRVPPDGVGVVCDRFPLQEFAKHGVVCVVELVFVVGG